MKKYSWIGMSGLLLLLSCTACANTPGNYIEQNGSIIVNIDAKTSSPAEPLIVDFKAGALLLCNKKRQCGQITVTHSVSG